MRTFPEVRIPALESDDAMADPAVAGERETAERRRQWRIDHAERAGTGPPPDGAVVIRPGPTTADRTDDNLRGTSSSPGRPERIIRARLTTPSVPPMM